MRDCLKDEPKMLHVGSDRPQRTWYSNWKNSGKEYIKAYLKKLGLSVDNEQITWVVDLVNEKAY